MNVLRSIGNDLVDKKLWPIVAILVAALAALPFFMKGGDDVPDVGGPVAQAATLSTPDGPSQPAVVPASEDEKGRDRDSGTRDPFRQQYVQKAVQQVTGGGVASAPSAPASSGGSTAPKPAASAPKPSTSAPSAPKATTPATTTPTKKTPTAKKAPEGSREVQRVSVRFGTPGNRRTLRNPDRLSPLPSINRPFFVYGGVLSGGEKAVFLAGVSAPSGGDGTCRPSRDACYMVELGEGESHKFTVPGKGGGTATYHLDVLSIRDETAKSATAAARERARTDSQGEALVAAIEKAPAAALDELYRYSEKAGVLVLRSSSARTAAGDAEPLSPQARIATIILEAIEATAK